MSIQTFILGQVRNFLGVGWSVGFTSGGFPKWEYVCSYCGKPSFNVSNASGFQGAVPVVKCCKDAVPYPVRDEEFLRHLSARPRFNDGVERRERFFDTDSVGFDGNFEYKKWKP